MPTRMVAFLRAINTGHRRLTNEQQLAPFRDAGFEDVWAYQAAGNIAFLADRDARTIEDELEPLLGAAYGFEVPVFVRTEDELRACVAAVPFTEAEIARTEGRTQVCFLASAPTPEQIEAVQALVPEEDLVGVAGREWYWLPRAGISTSKLPVGAVGAILGSGTMRTVGTVERLLARIDR